MSKTQVERDIKKLSKFIATLPSQKVWLVEDHRDVVEDLACQLLNKGLGTDEIQKLFQTLWSIAVQENLE